MSKNTDEARGEGHTPKTSHIVPNAKDLDGDQGLHKDRLFPVKTFAKLARTTRDTLHHYDEIGVLPPAKRGDNNYRYYSAAQISIFNVIRILQELGMNLDEISEVKDNRTPEFLQQLYAEQITKIDARIAEWVAARKLMYVFSGIIDSVRDVDESSISVQDLPPEPIVLGKLNDYSNNKHEWTALLEFYEEIAEQYPDIDLNYPVWGVFPEARIKARDWQGPERYYLYNPEGHDVRPAGKYAIGYARGGYGQTDELYERMLSYIESNNLEICGNTYEEYPLNELSIVDPNGYLIRVMIAVRNRP